MDQIELWLIEKVGWVCLAPDLVAAETGGRCKASPSTEDEVASFLKETGGLEWQKVLPTATNSQVENLQCPLLLHIYITLRIQHMFIFTPTKGPLPKIILEDFLDSCPNTIAIAILDGQGPKRPHQLCNNVWHRLVNTGKTLHFMYMTYHQAVTPHYWYPMGTAMCSSEGSPVLCWLVPVAPSTPVVDGTCKANWERNRSEGYARIILERVLSYLKSHANTPRRLDSQFWKPMFLHYITTYYIYIYTIYIICIRWNSVHQDQPMHHHAATVFGLCKQDTWAVTAWNLQRRLLPLASTAVRYHSENCP